MTSDPTTSPADAPVASSIDADTAVGAVRLRVRDLDRARGFYERVIGLQSHDLDDGSVSFGVDGGPALVALDADSSAPPLNRRATGLFHLAILVPSRLELALALARLAEARWPLDGASDHLVSEALYLSDPEGNGIEIYRDRPREQWRRSGDELAMATLPLDLDDVMGELRQVDSLQPLAPTGTRIGHVHLQVSNLDDAERFYHGVLGFDVVVRSYPGALFVSAGGYHHHIGLNTWNSAGASPPAPGSVGLRWFEVTLPHARARDDVLARVRAAGIPMSETESGPLIADPFANGVLLTAR